MHKNCIECSKLFFRRENQGKATFLNIARFCSNTCSAIYKARFKKRNNDLRRIEIFDKSKKITDKEVIKLFNEKIVKNNIGCWEWKGSRKTGGYGEARVLKKLMTAHILSYRIYKGGIINNLCVCHSCDNPICVNPDHLWLGTYKDNNNDKINKGRHGCLKGSKHPNSKLTENDVLHIRSSKLSTIDLARLYKMTKTTIHDIRKRKQWKHI